MITFLLVLGGVAATVAIVEGVLWHAFCSKVRGLVFPRALDESPFRFFSVPRMRIIALTHTVSFVLFLSFALISVW